MALCIACIVEGHGECESVPILIRRIATSFDPALAVHIPHPIRVPKSKLLKQGALEKAVELAAMQVGANGGILVLLDSDDECPAELAPNLLTRALSARHDVPSAVVLPNREFESWFLAAAESLRGHRGLATDLRAPTEPEAVRGAKEWLSQRINAGCYSSRVDQPSLTGTFNLEDARRAPSFDKCFREVTRLLDALRGRGSPN
jgi:hypothetical protein